MNRYFPAFAIMVLLAGCQERDRKGQPVDTPTTGTILIAVDESLRPIMEAEIAAFEGLYPEATIKAMYVSEDSAFHLLVRDSVRLVVATRRATAGEKELLLAHRIVPTEMRAGRGAVALITNKQSPDSVLHREQLREVLRSEKQWWSDLQAAYPHVPIKIVFDHPSSGVAKRVRDSLLEGNPLPANWFAVNNNTGVLKYIEQTPGAIGLIGVEWISDRDDSTANRFLSTVRVMKLAGPEGLVKPYQAYLATGAYPLIRETYIVSAEVRSGLGTGLMAFMASDKGQRIFLKAGLVPATMPVRIIEYKP